AVDVGAFEGGVLRHIVRRAPRGRHIAFEPLPEKRAALVRRFPNVQILPHALSDQPGEAEYHHVVKSPAVSGLRRNTALREEELVETVRVPVETLDRTVPEDAPVAFLKIDVEVGELAVLRGGVAMLRRTNPVVVFESGTAAAWFGAGARDI